MHCFTEDWETAKKALDLGFYISFSGIVSFKSAQQIKDAAKNMPRDRLLIETDSPYLIHCFTEDWETAKKALDLGFYISFSGIVSFKSAQQIKDAAKNMPRDRLLIETDSPYLAPVPKRGKPNEPAYVPYVASCIADMYGCSSEEVGALTAKNFENLLAQYH
ncbi:TatD family hydrolase [Psychrobacter sp. FME61]|uniref:TatD family hydrolase n=1 Tax=Psychrobacter sp. FME61 TaxID=2742611 RepID=UPI0039B0B0E7